MVTLGPMAGFAEIFVHFTKAGYRPVQLRKGGQEQGCENRPEFKNVMYRLIDGLTQQFLESHVRDYIHNA